ncbi:hypothetical protein HBB16_05880 [Pseudonocardia sp. MCCB 268]|nr:hypothetical protein [Pseudonocardia cytotoxica]
MAGPPRPRFAAARASLTARPTGSGCVCSARPLGMRAWLRRYAPAAGPHRVRLWTRGVGIGRGRRGNRAGRPVPLLVGSR